MSTWGPIVVMVGVPILLRLLDYFLPPNHHFRLVRRWVEPDADDKKGDGGEGDD